MNQLWDYIKNLFQQSAESTPSNPLLHEVIERTEEEKIAYANWKNTLVKHRLLNWLNHEYVNYLINPDGKGDSIDFLDTPSAKGFVVHFAETGYTKAEVVHFFDYLKERVLSLNYKSYLSDSRTYHRPQWVESVQRHYLKPRNIFRQGEKVRQGFGNITIEILQRNERIQHLKFHAATYQDHLYREADDFNDLLKHMFQ